MLLISTSNGWNYGDDIIREGVLRLLKVPSTWPTGWLNRCETQRGAHQWEVQRNFSLDKVMPSVTAFMEAGTPGWGERLQETYSAVSLGKVPAFIVGVAGTGPGARLRKLAPYIRAASARDSQALKMLRSTGLEAKKFFDPALHAGWNLREKDLGILNYRAKGGNGKHTSEDDRVYKTLYLQHKELINCVTVHEVTELPFARKLFPEVPIVFCADYIGFKHLYERCRLYIGGRIHGALSAVANGGQAHLMYRAPKKSVVADLETACRKNLGWSPIYLSGVTSKLKIEEPQFNRGHLKEFLEEDFRKHQEFALRNGAPWLERTAIE